MRRIESEGVVKAGSLEVLAAKVVACRKCPRLVRHRERVAREKRRAFRDCEYWGRPVPGFGDPRAELVIIGLAPAAHGANRTGRMFTGDRSGDFLYAMLHRAGFANQPTSAHRDDGLALRNAYITAAARCAPPGNKPLPQELANCRPFLETELDLIRPRAVLALGRIAFDAYLKLLQDRGLIVAREVPLSPRRVLRLAGPSSTPVCRVPSQPAKHLHRARHSGHVSPRLAQNSSLPGMRSNGAE